MISHWDRLPPEIQCYIVDLKYKRERMDVLTAPRKRLCEEMRLYHYLKEKWSIGHLRCEPHYCSLCMAFHARVYGHYREHRVLLGYSLKQAASNLTVARRNILNERGYFVFVLE